MTPRLVRRGGLRRHEVLLGGISAAAVVAAIALMGSAGASTAGGTIRAANSAGAVPGSYIVMLKDRTMSRSAVATTAQDMVSRHGGSIRQTWASAVCGFELRANARTARQLAGDAQVAYVEQNQVLRNLATQNDPPSFGLDRVDQRNLPADGAFTAPSTAANVQAWIIDSGIRVTHRDFGGRATFAFNAVNDGIDTDCNGHGTHVAGTVGGTAFAVAASDQSDARAGFSNFGRCVDIFAPGVGITSDFANSNNATQVLDGTSMSTPHVTGAAAIVLALEQGLTPQQVRDRLVADATPNKVADANGSPNRLLFVAQK